MKRKPPPYWARVLSRLWIRFDPESAITFAVRNKDAAQRYRERKNSGEAK